MSKKRVGIINSGGDSPGLNAVIAAVVKAGTRLGYEFVGFIKGWEGLLTPINKIDLTPESVMGISHLGGTILQTVNKGRFGAKASYGMARRIPQEVLEEAHENAMSLGLDGLIVIGGDGTLTGAAQLAELGLNIVGVPKTIDNDLQATDRTFGYSTAVQVVVDALDRIHTTATSHGRVMIVETMGRHAGWIAIRAGLAGGADAILLPEFPFEMENLVTFLRKRNKATIIVVAEGARISQDVIGQERKAQEILLGGISNQIMHAIERLAPNEFEMRGAVLGHIQRGGTPNAADRMLAKAYGVEAINAYHRGDFGKMVCYGSQNMQAVPIADAVGQLKLVRPLSVEYQAARQLGVFIH